MEKPENEYNLSNIAPVVDFLPVCSDPRSFTHNYLKMVARLSAALIVGLALYSQMFDNYSFFSSEISKHQALVNELGAITSGISALSDRLRRMDARVNGAEARMRRELAEQDAAQARHLHDRIREAFAVYEADKTGLVDFALESGGGSVVVAPEAVPYSSMKYVGFFGLLAHGGRLPRTILQAETHPGDCYAFSGQNGKFRVRLSIPVALTAVTIEHAPFATVVDSGSAPRDFVIYGLEDEEAPKGEDLGHFTFDIASGNHLQTFYFSKKEAADHQENTGKVNGEEKRYQFVELHILTNNNHPEYTCLYRFRVHGIP